MSLSVVSLISEDPVVVELVTSSVDPGFVVVASTALEQVGGSPRVILLEIADGSAALGLIERLRDRFPGTPIVTFGPQAAPCATEDHIGSAQLDSDRIRRVIRTVVERRDLSDELSWRIELLADSEARFRSLVVNSSDVIALLDRDGIYRYASPSVERCFGYQANALAGTNFVAMAHPEDASGVESFLATVRGNPGKPLTHSFRVRSSNEEWIDTEVVAANRLDDALVEGIVINMRDVTQRRQRERELRKTEAELRLLFNQLPAFVWTTDRKLRVTSTRGRGLSLIGSQADFTTGITIFEVFGATDASNDVVRVHDEALQGLSAETKAFPWNDRLLNAYVEPLRNEDGEITGTIGLTVDVTEQSQIHDRLGRSEEQYRSMIEMMGEGLVELDENEIAVFVNRRMCELLGHSPAALVGRQASEFLSLGPEDREIVAKELENRRRGVAGKYEIRARNAQGEWIDVLVSSAPRLDEEGHYKGSISLLTDITERRRAEDKIRQREQRLEFLVDRLPAALWTVDRDLLITSSRGGGLAPLGYASGELVGSPLAEYYGTDDPDLPELAMHRRALAGESIVVTNRSGSRVYETAIEPIRDGSGVVTGVFGFAIDVTDRRRAEFRLQMQFAVTKTLAECSTVSSGMDQVLEAMADSLGCTVGLFWRPADGGNALQTTNSWFAPACRPFVEASSRLRLKKSEGLPGVVWATQRSAWIADLSSDPNFRRLGDMGCEIVSGLALPIGVGGAFSGVLEILGPSPLQIDAELRAVIEDIARQIGLFIARVSAQAEIRLSRAQLAEAQRVARIGSWEWDFASNRVDVSAELLNILCIEPSAYEGTLEAFLNVFGSEGPSIGAVLDEARQRREEFEHDFILSLRDNRVRSFQARGSVALNHGGGSRMIGTVQDVTEQNLLKQGVERAQRLGSLGRVAGSIAHEFNNTLMGISPAAEFLVRHAADPTAANVAKRILQSVQRGKKITGEILRFAQPSEPDLEPIEVVAWLQGVARELREIVGATIEIQVIVPPVPLFIAGDIQQLDQVLINLGLNSTDAMPSGGQIVLTAKAMQSGDVDEFGLSEPHQYVHLEIKDTGSGIDADTIRQIFEPLFTTKKSGTGLGLAVVQQVITQHHGHVFVVSEPGNGTTFHLFLPSTAEPEKVEAPVARTADSISHKRLLLVEDDETVAAGIVEILRLENFEVEVVGEGKAVMAAIRRFRPDAVVLDVGLPDIPGTEVFLEIEKSWPDLPIVFSTGHADPALIEQAQGQHRVGFLHKPYSVATLLTVLAEVMA